MGILAPHGAKKNAKFHQFPYNNFFFDFVMESKTTKIFRGAMTPISWWFMLMCSSRAQDACFFFWNFF
jgi:hypothetical protein